jgi:hypothetical protein
VFSKGLWDVGAPQQAGGRELQHQFTSYYKEAQVALHATPLYVAVAAGPVPAARLLL